MANSRFVVVRNINLGRQGDYRVALCQFCGASAATREDSGPLTEWLPDTFADHHEHRTARDRGSR